MNNELVKLLLGVLGLFALGMVAFAILYLTMDPVRKVVDERLVSIGVITALVYGLVLLYAVWKGHRGTH